MPILLCQILTSNKVMKILTPGKYYGTKKSEVDFDGVILSEYDYSATRTDWHFHENPYFMYVLHGNLFDVNKKLKQTCQPGSLIFHNWQEAHYNSKETLYARGFHIEFPRAWFDSKKLNINLWEGSSSIDHPKSHHLLAKIYFEFRFQDVYSELSIGLLLLQLCENIQEAALSKSKQPAWVASLRQILNDTPDQITLQSLSDQLGVHPGHISRVVPKYFASSLGDYIRQQKIKKALAYLMNKNFSLTEIAHICGFSDQSHFTRTFKTYLQRTPSAFRKNVL